MEQWKNGKTRMEYFEKLENSNDKIKGRNFIYALNQYPKIPLFQYSNRWLILL